MFFNATIVSIRVFYRFVFFSSSLHPATGKPCCRFLTCLVLLCCYGIVLSESRTSLLHFFSTSSHLISCLLSPSLPPPSPLISSPLPSSSYPRFLSPPSSHLQGSHQEGLASGAVYRVADRRSLPGAARSQNDAEHAAGGRADFRAAVSAPGDKG